MELEPLRRYGFALDEATLKQVAYEKGITQSVETMTQAQKAQLRYVAILEQAGNIGVLGDMSRTIDTSANQLRILEARLQQFARAVGNMLMPILSQFLPYMTAFIQLLTEGAQAIAEFLGFELPKIDLNTSSVTSGYEDIADATNAATEATEKFKGSLAGVDQLNIIGSKNDSGAGSGNGLNYDLDIDLPSYDFLNGVESKTKEIFEGMKQAIQEALPYLEMALKTWIAFQVAAKLPLGAMQLGKFFTSAKRSTGVVTKLAASVAGGVGSLLLWKNAQKEMFKATDKANGALTTAIIGTVGIGAALTALTGPIGLVVTGFGSIAGMVIGVNEAQEELSNAMADIAFYAENGGISVSGLADGFATYFDTIASGHDDLIANNEAFKKNQTEIHNAADEVYYLTDKYAKLGGEITSGDAAVLSESIRQIGDSIQNNLGSATQSIVESLRTTFKSFAESMGQDVDDMIGKFYLLEAMGGAALTGLRKQADQIVSDIMGGDTSTQKLQELNDIVQQMSGSATAQTEQSVTFERAIATMDFAAIDFGDITEVEAAFERISQSALEARESIQAAWSAQTLEIESLKSQYESLGVDIQYDQQFGAGSFDALFADTIEGMNKSYQAELDKIATGQLAFASMMQNQMDINLQNAISAADLTAGESWDAINAEWWSSGLYFDWNEALAKANKAKAQRITEEYAPIQELIDNAIAGIDPTYGEEIGKYITEGLANGIINNQTELNTAISDISALGWEEFKRVNGIHSPSTVYADMSRFIPEGIAQGIRDNTIIVIAAIDELYRQMKEEAEKHQMLIAQKLAAGFGVGSQISYNIGDYETATRGDVFNGFDNIFSNNGSDDSDNARPIYIELHSTVDIDGDAVGEAVSRYNDRQVYVSNGR